MIELALAAGAVLMVVLMVVFAIGPELAFRFRRRRARA